MTDQQHVLYRFFDASGSLLYVGITRDPSGRFAKHAGTKEWWSEVRRIEMQNLPSKKAVLEAEQVAIDREHPRYNIMLKNGSGKITPELSVDAREDSFEGLLGRFFLIEDERLGQFVDREGDFLIAQTYLSTGDPGEQKLVTVADIATWRVYGSLHDIHMDRGCRESIDLPDGGLRVCEQHPTHSTYAGYRCSTHAKYFPDATLLP